ncbi:MAG TPA: 4-hydroxy-tetrahydrodipicolinate synthase [Acidimicrobiales bacterium]|nr:4-hydroxy-tetrahydrodipicolinate synthase [Acidimicrobiales bacterium]
MARFGRVLTAMVTPFDHDGALDLDGAAKLASWLVEQGNEGLVIAGTTGESPTLTHDEQIELVRTICQAVSVPVIAGAGSNDTRAAIELTEQATAAGASAILSVTPYYNRPSQAGLLAHYRAIAAATDLPIMLYDIPVRTGRKVDTATLLELAHDVPNIVALKDAAGNPAETALVIASAPEGFEVYSGDDALNLPLLSVGAVGVVSVAAHWAAAEIGEMIDAFVAGDVRRARELNALLIPSWQYESGDRNPNPVPTKAMLKVLGRPGGDCRPPMGPEPDDLQSRARAVLAGLGRL